jgi:hypothetical protein
MVLSNRKHFAQLMLSILQRVSFSPTVKVKFSFAGQELSTRSYFMIMTGYIEGIMTNSFWGCKTANIQLHDQRFYSIPSQGRNCEKIFILLLLFQHYSYFIVKYDFAEVDIHQAEPILLARIALVPDKSSMSNLFKSFNSKYLLLDGPNNFYRYYLGPVNISHYIYDFTKYAHSIPPIPDEREDLQWILMAYNKLRLHLIENNPFQ